MPITTCRVMSLYISFLMQLKVMKLGSKVLLPNKTTNNERERVVDCDCSSCTISGIESRKIRPRYRFTRGARFECVSIKCLSGGGSVVRVYVSSSHGAADSVCLFSKFPRLFSRVLLK